MSEYADLLAHNDSSPWSVGEAVPGRVFVARGFYRVPAFWLFCFDPGDLSEVSLTLYTVPTLTAPLARVRDRLAERQKRVLGLFPDHADLWAWWRDVIGALGQDYLKVEMEELCPYGPGELKDSLSVALTWVSTGEGQIKELLALSRIEKYDWRTGRVSFREYAERFLYGWLEDEG